MLPSPSMNTNLLSRPSELRLPPNPTVTDKIEAILDVMGMTRGDLRNLLGFIIGGMGEQVDEPAQQLANANDENKEKVLAYLDTMERRQMLASQGYVLPPQELEALFGSAEVTFDEQTLQLVEPSGLRRFLSMFEVKKLAVLLTQLELAIKAKLQASSIADNPDFRVRTLKDAKSVKPPAAMLKDAIIEMDIAKVFQASQLSLKGLLEGAVSFLETFIKPKKDSWNRDGDARDIFELVDKANEEKKEEKKPASINKEMVQAETQKVVKRLEVLDYQSDIERMLLVERDRSDSQQQQGTGGTNDMTSQQEQDTNTQSQQLNQPQQQARTGAAAGQRSQARQQRSEQRGQRTRQREENQQQRSERRAASRTSRHAAAKQAMEIAEAEVKGMSEKEASSYTMDTGKTLSGSVTGNAKEAKMDDLHDSLAKIKDQKKIENKEVGK